MENKMITENDEISLKELVIKAKEWINYLLSKWKIIVLAGIIGCILGLTYSFIKKPIYTATLSFALEYEKSVGGLGGAQGLASSLGLEVEGSGGGIFSGSNLTELFKSRKMVEEALLAPILIGDRQTTLAEEYIKNNEWRSNWENNAKLKNVHFLPNLDRKQFTRIHDSILGIMHEKISKEGLTVGLKDKKASIISIDMISTNELFAKFFCESLAQQVGIFYITTKSKKAIINMAILERQVDSIRGELNVAITGVAVANDNTFNLNPALNVRRAPSARRQVDVQANTAILTELVKQAEFAKVTVRKETPLIQVIDRPILPLEKESFSKIKGILFGVFLGCFIIVVLIVLKKMIRDIN